MAFWSFWGLATAGLPALNLVLLASDVADGSGALVGIAALEAIVLLPLAASEYEDRPTAVRVWLAGVAALIALTALYGFLIVVLAFHALDSP